MPHYSYLLFDADNTLFDFDAANRNAFHAVCRQCDIPDTDETLTPMRPLPSMSAATTPCGLPSTEASVLKISWW